MISLSPRHSEMTLAKTARPSTSCHDLRVPMTSCRSAEPFPGSEVTIWSLTDVECMTFFFLPKGENWIFWNGRIVLSEPSFQSPPPRADSAACGKGGKRQLLQRWSTPRTFCPMGAVKWHLQGAADTAVCCPPMEGGWSRNRKNVLKSLQHHKRETKNRTKSTEKVERLRDNPRGLSEVIYNRDCKMVN